MAAEAVDLVLRQLNELDGRPAHIRCRTAEEPVPGGESRDMSMVIQDAERDGASGPLAQRLARLYGAEAPAVLRLAKAEPGLAAPVVAGYPAIRAELVHALRREMALTLGDLLIRRTHLFYEVVGHAAAEAPMVADIAARELGWDADRKQAELTAYLAQVRQGATFRTELRERFARLSNA
jgi:glycerol-3-phosphate dehydrogenase